jgi:opacity protein-like surface antigen
MRDWRSNGGSTHMQIIRIATSCLWLGLVLAAGFPGVATANGRGPAAVPVPAPVPAPDFAAVFYLRGDIGYNWSDADSFGTEYDVYAPTLREDSGLDEFARYGFGIGRYLARWLRADITIDVRNEITGDADGTAVYISPLTGLQRTDVITDAIRSRTWTGLVNGYVDLPMGHAFTPYIGAGVGLVLHTFSRTLNQTITCTDAAVTDCDPDTAGVQTAGFQVASFAGSGKDYAFALAAAVMVGASYDISHNTKFDFGYRALFLDGADFALGVGAGNPNQHVIIPDQTVHELRVGLRFDIE